MARLIAIVTGANTGVGFGICLRLLIQLSQQAPSDAQPQERVDPNFALSSRPLVQSPYNSATLVLACRSKERALDARERLLVAFDVELLRRKRNNRGEDDAYARHFRDTLQIDFVQCDLASVSSVFEFCDVVKQRYPYISHLICNAGISCFTAIDYYAATWQILRDPLAGATHPTYISQSSGLMSDDGLGLVWQCNVFSHYLVQRELKELLCAAPSVARVIWLSSMGAAAGHSDPEDWQLIRSLSAYQASKHQIEIIAHQLNEPPNPHVRHIVVGPGAVHSGMGSQLLGPLTSLIMIIYFYIVRWMGSPNHPGQARKGAISATHASLAPIDHLPPSSSAPRLDAQTDRLGNEFVNVSRTDGHTEMSVVAGRLLERIDGLCETFEARDGRREGADNPESGLDGSVVIV
ncbi:uncharacterized protein EI90DRAFT_2967674 [Cantharellus anzutake]|uniref:uncharacterized protein n=1 Tax=Cantharellus anzutake TaxID=1750568 RepID=UPI0019089AE0|nr:uncharacterized protein EI90DRAFT_2967674 [Cantharellus anzutake]KAF8339197.1 hypothetical protein EI90DRAFT_2967674 [Cantharellus anzutake]